mgnify:CR=1 FL=1
MIPTGFRRANRPSHAFTCRRLRENWLVAKPGALLHLQACRLGNTFDGVVGCGQAFIAIADPPTGYCHDKKYSKHYADFVHTYHL